MQDSEITLTVKSVRRATPATRIVRLDLGGRRFAFKAGQVALIGTAGRTERVPYSIASAPEEARRHQQLEFLIKVEPSGRWGHLFDGLARGQRMGVRGPYGSFVIPSNPRARSFLFIAGGTGIAPIRAMIRHVGLTRPAAHLKLLYSARTAADFAYLPELRGMARRGELELRLHVTRDSHPGWRGERGRITLAHLHPLVDTPATLSFVCGPAGLVADVPRMLEELGVPAENVLAEAW